MNKTSVPSLDSIDRQWFLVDAENQTLGRLATEVASLLRGKTKPNFTPHLDTGDFVIVVNAEKIQVTGKKSDQLFDLITSLKLHYQNDSVYSVLKVFRRNEQDIRSITGFNRSPVVSG